MTVASRRVRACASTNVNLSGMATVVGICNRAPASDKLRMVAVDADRAACKDDLPALEHPLARATALAVHALKRKLERSVPTPLPTKKERRDGGTHRSQCMPGEGGPGLFRTNRGEGSSWDAE